MKKLSLFFFVALLGLFWFSPALAQEKISNYLIDLRLAQDSSLSVSEQINYDFGSAQKHGIFRQIPVYYRGDSQTKSFILHISNISVTDALGLAYTYDSYRQGDYLIIKIGDANKFVSGQKTYIIKYRVNGAVLFFDTYDELYWNAIGTDWQIPIDQARVTLELPGAATSSQSVFKCWSGIYGAKTACQSLILDTISPDKVSGLNAQQSNLASYQALTILAQLPKGLLDEAAAAKFAPKQESIIIGNVWGSPWFFLLPLLVFMGMYFIWNSKGRDPKGRGNIIAEYDVPNDLRPAEVGAIVYEKFQNSFLTAEIIYLASRGYIKIIRQPKTGMFGQEDFILEKVKEPDKLLKDYEVNLLAHLFVSADKENNRQVRISELKNDFYLYVATWKEQVWTLLKSEKYYVNPGQTSKILLIILGSLVIVAGLFVLFLGVVLNFANGMGIELPFAHLFGVFPAISLFLSGVVIIIFGRLMPQKTSEGVLTKEYLLGLKEYLEVAEKDRLAFHNAPDKDPQTFEKLLPYAIVFGVEQQWAEKFKGIYNTPPSWYSDPTMSNFNSILFISSLHNFASSSVNSLAVPTHSGGGAGGFGGGGGFSGGGFGGGGGGSW